MKTPLDAESLVQCANRMADLLRVAHPERIEVLRVVEYVVDEREAVAGVEMGIITPEEAVLLLLAHFHSSLFSFAPPEPGRSPWEDMTFLEEVRASLLGRKHA